MCQIEAKLPNVAPHLKFSTVEGAVTIAHSSNPSDPPMISGPDGSGEWIHGATFSEKD